MQNRIVIPWRHARLAPHHYQHYYPYGHTSWTVIVIVVIAVAALGLVTRWRR